MATYNGAKYLDEQLRSLAEQTQLPAELVICDDGSQDGTLQIAAAFAATVPFPVHIHRNEQRLGYRANFMRAASLCQSELVAFSDQDDIWEPSKIETCARPFQDPEVLLTYHNALAFELNGREIGLVNNRAAPSATNPPLSLDPWLNGLGFTIVLRRDLLALDGLWSNSVDQYALEKPLAHDQWFFFLASALGNIAYIDDALVRYRQHDANLYGWERRWHRRSRITRLVPFRRRISRLIYISDVERAASFAAAARKRAQIMDSAQDMLTGQRAKLAVIARDKYLRLARCYDAWCRLRERLKAFRELATIRALCGRRLEL